MMMIFNETFALIYRVGSCNTTERRAACDADEMFRSLEKTADASTGGLAFTIEERSGEASDQYPAYIP